MCKNIDLNDYASTHDEKFIKKLTHQENDSN